MSPRQLPATEEIEAALEARTSVGLPHDPFDGRCHRCYQKNVKRRYVDVDPEPGSVFNDGERVILSAHWAPAEATGMEYGYWRIREIVHAHHALRQLADHATLGFDQVRARANITVEADPHSFENVDIADRSRPQDGMKRPPVAAEREKHLTADPRQNVSVPADEPMPAWPDETREWFDELLAEHGPPDVPIDTPDSFLHR